MNKIIISLTVFFFLCAPFSAFAAIAYDTSSDLGVSGNIDPSPATYSYTNTGSNLADVVCFQAPAAVTISSVTYNGSGLTQLAHQTDHYGGGSLYIYELTGASSGTHNLVFTYSGGNIARPKVASYTGVSGTDGTGQNEQSATSLTVTQTTTVANDWLVSCFKSNNSNTAVATAGTNTTSRNAANYTAIMDSNGGRSVGSNSTQALFSGTPTDYNEGVQVALKPAATVVPWVFAPFTSWWTM